MVDPTGNAPVISRMSIWRFSSKLGIQILAVSEGFEPSRDVTTPAGLMLGPGELNSYQA